MRKYSNYICYHLHPAPAPSPQLGALLLADEGVEEEDPRLCAELLQLGGTEAEVRLLASAEVAAGEGAARHDVGRVGNLGTVEVRLR